MNRALIVLSMWVMGATGVWAQDQGAKVYKLKGLIWPQIDALDRQRTLFLRALRGENMFVHARNPETMPPDLAPILEKGLANEAAFEAKLDNWLAERRTRKERP